MNQVERYVHAYRREGRWVWMDGWNGMNGMYMEGVVSDGWVDG